MNLNLIFKNNYYDLNLINLKNFLKRFKKSYLFFKFHKFFHHVHFLSFILNNKDKNQQDLKRLKLI